MVSFQSWALHWFILLDILTVFLQGGKIIEYLIILPPYHQHLLAKKIVWENACWFWIPFRNVMILICAFFHNQKITLHPYIFNIITRIFNDTFFPEGMSCETHEVLSLVCTKTIFSDIKLKIHLFLSPLPFPSLALEVGEEVFFYYL